MYFPSENTILIQFYSQWINQQNQFLMQVLAKNNEKLYSFSNINQEKIKQMVGSTSQSEFVIKEEPILEKKVLVDEIKVEKVKNRKIQVKKKKEKKDKTFYPKKQKKDRNVISNLIHHLFKFIYQSQKFEAYLSKIIKIYRLKITHQRFYHILDIFNERMKSYVTEVNFRQLLMGESRQLKKYDEEQVIEFSKILRIICNKFYRKECYQSIMHSLKLTLQSKDLHYVGMRQMQKLLKFLSFPEPLQQ